MRFPLRPGARQGESEAGKETIRTQTGEQQAQTSACAGQDAFLFLLSMFIICLFSIAQMQLLYSLSQM